MNVRVIREVEAVYAYYTSETGGGPRRRVVRAVRRLKVFEQGRLPDDLGAVLPHGKGGGVWSGPRNALFRRDILFLFILTERRPRARGRPLGDVNGKS